MLVRGGDELTMLIQRTPSSLLEPLTFFVSWQGVPTLAYRSPSHSWLILAEIYGSPGKLRIKTESV